MSKWVCVFPGVCTLGETPGPPLGLCPGPSKHLVMKLPPRKFPVNTVKNQLLSLLSYCELLLVVEMSGELAYWERAMLEGQGRGLSAWSPEVHPGLGVGDTEHVSKAPDSEPPGGRLSL